MAHSDGEPHQFARVSAIIARFISYLIYAYLVLVEIFLGIGFFLLLFGADQNSQFTRFVYRSVERTMNPFNGVFKQIPITNDVNVPSVFDPSILLAMIVYGVIAIAFHSLIEWLSRKVRQYNIEDRLHDQHVAYREAAQTYQAPLPNVMGDSKHMPAPKAGTAQTSQPPKSTQTSTPPQAPQSTHADQSPETPK